MTLWESEITYLFILDYFEKDLQQLLLLRFEVLY